MDPGPSRVPQEPPLGRRFFAGFSFFRGVVGGPGKRGHPGPFQGSSFPGTPLTRRLTGWQPMDTLEVLDRIVARPGLPNHVPGRATAIRLIPRDPIAPGMPLRPMVRELPTGNHRPRAQPRGPFHLQAEASSSPAAGHPKENPGQALSWVAPQGRTEQQGIGVVSPEVGSGE